MKNMLPNDGVFLSLLAVFLLLPFAQVKITFGGVPVYLPEIAILSALCFYGWRSFFSATLSWKQWRVDTLFAVGVFLFLGGAVSSFFSNPHTFTGLGMLKSWFFFPTLGAWLVYSEAQNVKKCMWFMIAWFATLSATALGGLIFLALGIVTYDNRLTGLYTSPNFLAVFLAPGILLAWFLFFWYRVSAHQRILWHVLLVVGGIGIMMNVYHTRSYGVWMALLVALTLVVLGRRYVLQNSRNTALALMILAIFGGSLLFFEYGSDKWQAVSSFEERSSLSSRFMIWRAAGKILADHWLLGIGPGRFQVEYLDYQRYFPPYLEWAVPEPHNWYLATWLSTGMMGFIGFIVLVGRFLFLHVRMFFHEEQKEKRILALMMISGVTLFLVYGLADTPYFKNDLILSFWLLLALGLSLLPRPDTFRTTAPSKS
jgi:O-antigen ligase